MGGQQAVHGLARRNESDNRELFQRRAFGKSAVKRQGLDLEESAPCRDVCICAMARKRSNPSRIVIGPWDLSLS